jgi:hypothetical protein
VATLVTITQPVTNTLIAPSDTSVVVEVTAPGINPARTLTISINSVLVLAWAGGSTTFVAAGYTALATLLGSGNLEVTLTKSTPWPNPQNIQINTNYRVDGTAPGVDATTVSALAAYAILAVTSPVSGEADVPLSADLRFLVTSSVEITSLTAYVNEALALTASRVAPSTVWSTAYQSPNFVGRLTATTQSLSVAVSPRRNFPPDRQPTITVDLRLTSDFTTTVDHRLNYAFTTSPRRTSFSGPTLRGTRLTRPFSGQPAADSLRRALIAALSPRPSPPPPDVLFYACVVQSSLSSVRSQFGRRDLDPEVSRIAFEDRASITQVDAVMKQFDILWDPALDEAISVGVDPALVALLADAYRCPYPQERVGAVAALLFAMAPLAL